jgi:hypothetical protein
MAVWEFVSGVLALVERSVIGPFLRVLGANGQGRPNWEIQLQANWAR